MNKLFNPSQKILDGEDNNISQNYRTQRSNKKKSQLIQRINELQIKPNPPKIKIPQIKEYQENQYSSNQNQNSARKPQTVKNHQQKCFNNDEEIVSENITQNQDLSVAQNNIIPQIISQFKTKQQISPRALKIFDYDMNDKSKIDPQRQNQEFSYKTNGNQLHMIQMHKQIKESLRKSKQSLSPSKQLQQQIQKQNVLSQAINEQILDDKNEAQLTTQNINYNTFQQQFNSQQIQDYDQIYEKFTPSKLLQITEEFDMNNPIIRQDTQLKKFESNKEFRKSISSSSKIKEQQKIEYQYQIKQTVIDQQFKNIYLEEDCCLNSDSSYYSQDWQNNEVSCDTQNNYEGPTFNNKDNKIKFKNKNLQQITENKRTLIYGRSEFTDEVIDVINHDNLKTDIISQYNKNKKTGSQNSPIKVETKIYRLHQRHSANKSDCSSILNESTNIKEVMKDRSNKKQFLKNLSIKDAIVNMDSLPSQQTINLSSPQSSKINSLIELNLRLANIKELTEQLFISNLFIRSIDIRNNRLVKIPDQICDLPHLWKIRIDYNYLIELPQNIGNIAKLEYLTVSQNKIIKLPLSITSIQSHIGVLHLNDNKIDELPLNIGNLTELRSFLLHNNNLSQLPSSIYKLQKLNEFSLDWFIYHFKDRLIPKILKDETGRIIIVEFLKFMQFYEKVIDFKKESQVSFIHYFMFFHKLQKASEIQEVLFPKKRTIFHLLALNGSLFLFHELYNLLQSICKIDLNQLDEEDSTPLLLAIKNKRKDFIKHLLSLQIININRGSYKYGYPLHLLIQTHNFKLALKLIMSDQDDIYKYLDINVKNDEGNNAMHFLFMNFSINPQLARKVAAQLIKRGININTLNKNDLSPLQIAIVGSQLEAVQFAIDHNDLMRQSQYSPQFQLSFSKQLFDFNLKGGKFNQNSIHLAVVQNNMKMIIQILQSDEIINHQDIDDEGRMAKDICAYNSPIYKLLQQYENKLIRNISFKNSNPWQQESNQTLHLNYNLRQYKKQKNYKRLMHQRSMPNLDSISKAIVKSINSERDLNYQSLGRTSFKPKYDSNAMTSRVPIQNKNLLLQDSSSQEDSRKLNHYKLFSNDQNLYYSQTKNMLSSMNDIASDGVDEFSNQDFQTNKAKLTTQQLEDNLSRNIRFKSTKNYDEDQIIQQKKVSQNALLIMKRGSFEGTNNIKLNDNVSSPDDSQIFHQSYINDFLNKDVCEENKGDFILKQPFKLGLNDSLSLKYSKPKMNCGSFAPPKQDAPTVHNQSDYDNCQQCTVDDDDANIPEEENEQSNQKQLEQKSPIRILNRNQTASGNEIEIESSYKQQAYVKKIIEEVNRCKSIGTQAHQIQIQQNMDQVKFQDSNRVTRLSFTQSKINPSILVQSNQEQGNVNIDQSSLCIVVDDCIGILPPMEEQFCSPRIAYTQKEFNNLKTKLTQEIFKENQKILNPQESINNKVKMTYKVMLQAITRKDIKVKQLMIENCQNLNFINENGIMLLIDSFYYASQAFSLNEILEMIQDSINLDIKTQATNQVTKIIKELLLFELINAHQIKIYDQKKKLQLQISLLDRQKLLSDMRDNYQTNTTIQKLKHMTKSPSVKIFKYKSPSRQLQISISDKDQLPNVSPLRQMGMKDYNTNQNIIEVSPEGRIETYNSISSSKINLLSHRMKDTNARQKILSQDFRGSVYTHKSNLSHKINQPLTQQNQYVSQRDQFKFSTEIDRYSLDETVLSEEAMPQSSPKSQYKMIKASIQDQNSLIGQECYQNINQKHEQLLRNLENGENISQSQDKQSNVKNLNGGYIIQNSEQQQNLLKEKLFMKTHNLQSTIHKYNLSKHIKNATTMIKQNIEGTPKHKGNQMMKFAQLIENDPQIQKQQEHQDKIQQIHQSYDAVDKLINNRQDIIQSQNWQLISQTVAPKSLLSRLNNEYEENKKQYNDVLNDEVNFIEAYRRNEVQNMSSRKSLLDSKMYYSESQQLRKCDKKDIIIQQPNKVQIAKSPHKILDHQQLNLKCSKNVMSTQSKGQLAYTVKNSEIQSRKMSKDLTSSKLYGISRSTAHLKQNLNQPAQQTQKFPESQQPIISLQKKSSKPNLQLSSTHSQKNLKQIFQQQPLYKNSRQHQIQTTYEKKQQNSNVQQYYPLTQQHITSSQDCQQEYIQKYQNTNNDTNAFDSQDITQMRYKVVDIKNQSNINFKLPSQKQFMMVSSQSQKEIISIKPESQNLIQAQKVKTNKNIGAIGQNSLKNNNIMIKQLQNTNKNIKHQNIQKITIAKTDKK